MSPTGQEPTQPDTAPEENASPPADAAQRRTPLDPAAQERARARAEAIAYRAQDRVNRAKARTLTNMFWAMLVTLLVVAFLMLVTWRPKEEKVRAVEYTAQLADAKKVAPWILGPSPLPPGWTATNVEFRAPQQSPITWHLGTVTDQRKYVGLEQSNVTTRGFQNDELGKTEDDGTSTVGGVVWQRRTLLEREGEHALVRVGSGITTIVVGDAGYPALETFAATLR
ncbi:hypothetical protein Kfla_5586 [Kribbella flavida DSM 17836]|uniref:DUF4245 domain-containing protein n=1 Tax=Kribbella flavida (strain DSM 17836 / JCM 10339 / NBRC 14399) TaxID=479435 RepID=D2PNA8_KRIFD|nr:DUF4245 domain-containing protein [Kribbella flavida]ADB34592.1 hypothetical protein Kfla_5586 [Kribbella flavida DSM 17836]